MWGPRARYTNSTTGKKNNKKRKRKRSPPPPNAGDDQEHASASPKHTISRHQPHPLSTNSVALAPQIQQEGRGHCLPRRVDDNSCNCSRQSVLPEKRTLELIIDILQRRDAHEIFAEPVDPNEVEDYYEIIKEPMDFGTMRAKLHEGMYQSLDQFKHDVFLITRNAMHFNPSATVYFRQARAIYELAKRVFHVLETDPKNFEVEFSGTRRRSTRRAQSEGIRLAAHVKPSSVTTQVSSDSAGPSIVGLSSRGNSWLSTRALRTSINDYAFVSGARAAQRSIYIERDRRFSYRPQNYPFGCDHDLIVSKFFRSKPLILTNRQGTKYRESLLLFVKDLGPTARTIASQKMRGLHHEISPGLGVLQNLECQVPAGARGAKHHSDAVSTITDLSNYVDQVGIVEARGRDKKRSMSGVDASPGDQETEGLMNAFSATGRGKSIQNNPEFWLGTCASGDDASCGGSWTISNNFTTIAKSTTVALTADAPEYEGGKSDDNIVRPVVLALEHSHPKASHELKSRNKKSCVVSSSSGWASQSKSSSSSSRRLDINAMCSCHGAIGSSVTPIHELQAFESKNEKIKEEPAVDVLTPFTFDMGFLKAQLNQMSLAAAAGGRGAHWNNHKLQSGIRSSNWDRDAQHETERASFIDIPAQNSTVCNTFTNMETLNCSRL